MSLPVVGYLEILKVLRKKDFSPIRQTGSHIIVENGMGLWVSVLRKKKLDKGLMLSIISDCGLTKKEFLKLL